MDLMHVLVRATNQIVRDNPDKVQQARKRQELAGWFVGQIMKATNGIYSEDDIRSLLANRGIRTPEQRKDSR